MNCKKRRPAALRSYNMRLQDPESLETSIIDKYEMAKSEPDILNVNYIDYRRPWYTNPDYKGPINLDYSFQHPKDPIACSVRTLPQIQQLMDSEEALKLDERQCCSSGYRIKEKGDISRNVNSLATTLDPADISSFFSFDNLLDAKAYSSIVNKANIHGNSLVLSSSPESIFSTQNSSTGSSEKHPDCPTTDHIPILAPKHLMKSEVLNQQKYSISSRPRAQNMERTFDSNASDVSKLNSVLNRKRVDPKHSHLRVAVLKGENTGSKTINTWSTKLSSKCHRSNENVLDSNFQKLNIPTHLNTVAGQEGSTIYTTFNSRSQQKRNSSLTIVSDESSLLSFKCKNEYLSHCLQNTEDALYYVFFYLDTKSLARCGEVCKLWYSISRLPNLWKKIRMKNSKVPPNTLRLMSRWCTQVYSLGLENIVLPQPIGDCSSNPKYSQKHFEANLEVLIEINKESLATLRIVDCDEVIKGSIFWPISMHCKNLTKLVYLSSTNPLGQDDLYPLGKGCQKITSLIIPPGWPCSNENKFNDSCCETIAKCWPKLQILCVGGRSLTAEGLNHIAKGCVKLQQLEIDHGPEVTESTASKMVAFGLRGLEKLDFTFTPISPRAAIIFNNACPKLEHLGIHCNISDYFTDPTSSKSKAHFTSLKTLFKRLKSRSGFCKVLDIDLEFDISS